jgi:hypothetical protein
MAESLELRGDEAEVPWLTRQMSGESPTRGRQFSDQRLSECVNAQVITNSGSVNEKIVNNNRSGDNRNQDG